MKRSPVISIFFVMLLIGLTVAGFAAANSPVSLPPQGGPRQSSGPLPNWGATASGTIPPVFLPQAPTANRFTNTGMNPDLIFTNQEFLEAPQSKAGTEPLVVASGDFNGDGKVDLVALDYNCKTNICPAGRFSILLGKGDGTFKAPVSYDTVVNPNAVVIADLNGDGIQDLAITTASEKFVTVYLGNGDGTFGTGVEFATAGYGTGVATGDFNNDGNVDLAVSTCASEGSCVNTQASKVSVLLGNGDGTFGPHADFRTGNTAVGLATADFNGDHKLDLAVVSECGTGTCDGFGAVSVLLGNGDGTFQPFVDYGVGSAPAGITVGDFNGDGKADLAVANNCGSGQCTAVGSLSILLGDGDGTFQPQHYFDIANNPNAIAAADFDGDGRLDVVVSDYDNNVSVALGNGDGTFQTAQYYGTGVGSTDVTIADVNGDGHPDLIASNGTENSVSVILNSGDGTFKSRKDYPGPAFIYHEAVADLNHDGKLDIVGAGSYGATVALGNGNGTFQPYVTYPAGGLPYAVAIGDFNHDGNPDLAVVNDQSPAILDILLGNGDGTFQNPVGYTAGVNSMGVVVGDFNSDGKLDVAVANECADSSCRNGSVSIFLGNGNGTFQQAVNYPLSSFATSITVGDFNGDGSPDLAVSESNNSRPNLGIVSILLGNGDGTFQPHVDYPTANGAYSVATGDFNKDGKADLAVACRNNASVSVLLGNGDGTFQPYVSYVVGSEPDSINVADFNGDGNQDLTVAVGGAVSVLLGNGNGTFGTASIYPTGYTDALGVGDFNGDHLLDIVTIDGQQSISVLLNTGIAPSISSARISLPPQKN